MVNVSFGYSHYIFTIREPGPKTQGRYFLRGWWLVIRGFSFHVRPGKCVNSEAERGEGKKRLGSHSLSQSHYIGVMSPMKSIVEFMRARDDDELLDKWIGAF